MKRTLLDTDIYSEVMRGKSEPVRERALAYVRAHHRLVIYGDLERTGQPIGRVDPLVAGIALHHGLVLATGNVEHYERVRALGYALEIDNWRNPAPT